MAVLNAIKTYIEINGYSPTRRELADSTGMSPSTVTWHLAKLTAMGAIEHHPGTTRGIALRDATTTRYPGQPVPVETTIQPPGLDDPPDEPDEPDEPSLGVYVSVLEADGTSRYSAANISGQADDERLAEALVSCLRGVAAARGPGLAGAVSRRLT